MKRHRSLPHNPLIANGFFRAGYVETWGRGIEKICEACEKHGVPLPEYVLHPEDIMVTFRTNESQSLTKAPKPQGEALEEALENILKLIIENPTITQMEIMDKMGISRTSVQRIMNRLTTSGVLVREGGKRYGRWKVEK